jgi:hypothetical protein
VHGHATQMERQTLMRRDLEMMLKEIFAVSCCEIFDHSKDGTSSSGQASKQMVPTKQKNNQTEIAIKPSNGRAKHVARQW